MPGLGFLAPLFLAGALAAAVPFLLHLFRREAAPLQDFSAVRFVRRAPVEQTRQRRLSDVFLLALRMAAILILAVAFARPFLRAQAGAAGQQPVVVVLDVSGSMSAPATWQEARLLARDVVARAGSVPVGLVTFDDEARTLVQPISDRGAVLAAIDAAAPGAGGTRYRAAFTAAVDLLAGRPGRIVLVGDLQRGDLDAAAGGWVVPDNVRVETVAVPAARENLSVTAVNATAQEVAVVVASHGTERRTARVSLALDGRRVGEMEAIVEPGASAEVRIPASPPPTGVVEVAVRDERGATADNRRILVLDRPPAMPVLVVTGTDTSGEASLFVTRALEAATSPGGGTALAVDVRRADHADLTAPGALERSRVIVVVGTRGLDRRARERIAGRVAEGAGLLVAAGPDVEAGAVRALLGEASGAALGDAEGGSWPATLGTVDPRHPLFAALGGFADRLVDVRIDRGVRIDPGSNGRVLARFSNGLPALVEIVSGRGRALLFASDLGRRWNQFPLHSTFAPFVLEAVRAVAGPSDDRRELAISEVPAGHPRRPGVLTVGNPPRRVAVNVDPREMRPDAATREDILAAVVRAAATPGGEDRGVAERERRQGLWRWALAAVFALLVIEALVATSRRRPSSLALTPGPTPLAPNPYADA